MVADSQVTSRGTSDTSHLLHACGVTREHVELAGVEEDMELRTSQLSCLSTRGLEEGAHPDSRIVRHGPALLARSRAEELRSGTCGCCGDARSLTSLPERASGLRRGATSQGVCMPAGDCTCLVGSRSCSADQSRSRLSRRHLVARGRRGRPRSHIWERESRRRDSSELARWRDSLAQRAPVSERQHRVRALSLRSSRTFRAAVEALIWHQQRQPGLRVELPARDVAGASGRRSTCCAAPVGCCPGARALCSGSGHFRLRAASEVACSANVGRASDTWHPSRSAGRRW